MMSLLQSRGRGCGRSNGRTTSVPPGNSPRVRVKPTPPVPQSHHVWLTLHVDPAFQQFLTAAPRIPPFLLRAPSPGAERLCAKPSPPTVRPQPRPRSAPSPFSEAAACEHRVSEPRRASSLAAMLPSRLTVSGPHVSTESPSRPTILLPHTPPSRPGLRSPAGTLVLRLR